MKGWLAQTVEGWLDLRWPCCFALTKRRAGFLPYPVPAKGGHAQAATWNLLEGKGKEACRPAFTSNTGDLVDYRIVRSMHAKHIITRGID